MVEAADRLFHDPRAVMGEVLLAAVEELQRFLHRPAQAAGVEIRTELKGFHPYIDITAEHEFSRRGPNIVFSQTSAPVIVNTWDVHNKRDTYARVSGGGSATISGGLSIDAAIASTLGRDAGQEVSAQLGLKARF